MSQENSIPSPSNLESLVPPLELCRKIPEGQFSRSVFVWSYSCDKRKTEPFLDERDCIEFCRRDMVNAPPVFPAPNAIEIFLALAEIGADMPSLSMRNNNTWTADCWARIDPQDPRMYHVCIDDPNPATAAMKLWLHVYNGMALQ